MNKELMEQLLPIIEKTKEGVLRGVELAQEQMPELIQQLLLWHGIKSFLFFLLGVVILVGTGILLKIIIPKTRWNEPEVVCYMFFIFPIVSGFTVVLGNITWLKVLVAPKLFLIEYISNLIK